LDRARAAVFFGALGVKAYSAAGVATVGALLTRGWNA